MGKQKRDVPSWQECADAGMTAKQAAEARGVTKQAASKSARKYGLCFANGWTPEAKAANSARVKALHADPAYKAKRSAAMKAAWADPRAKAKRVAAMHPHLAKLTAAERADYDLLCSKGYRRDEALAAIGRGDLVRADP